MKKLLAYLITFLLFTGCIIQEQLVFEKDGSGVYSMAFNLDQFMESDRAIDSTLKEVDTLIAMASYLNENKDSIAQLSKEEQDRLELLRPLSFALVVNDSLQKFNVLLSYAFSSLDDIDNFPEAARMANIVELGKQVTEGSQNKRMQLSTDSASSESEDFYGLSKYYTTKFSARGFSRTLSAEIQEKIDKREKDTTSNDDSYEDAVILRQVYKFPYKIKSVDNPNAKIHADFKGVEVEANLKELENNPDIFNIKIKFEQ